MKEDISVLCAGLGCIDIVDWGEENRTMLGGTAANVGSALASLGFQVDFLAAHYGGDSGKWLERAMRRRGIQPLYFTETKFPAPKIIETLESDGGAHAFRTKCPVCDKSVCRLVLPTGSQIDRKMNIANKSYNLIMYDRISEGIRKVVEENQCGWKFYEPNSVRVYSTFLEGVKTADIMKISKERLPDSYESRLLADIRNTGMRLLIVSLGENGLKISMRNHNNEFTDWIYVESVPVRKLVDSSGAGDWATAIFLSLFLRHYQWRNDVIDSSVILDCLRQAQEVASESCSYIGAQGMLCAARGTRYLSEKFCCSVNVCSDERYTGVVCDSCEK